MGNEGIEQPRASRWHLTADWWAVIASLALAVLVKIGALPRIPW